MCNCKWSFNISHLNPLCLHYRKGPAWFAAPPSFELHWNCEETFYASYHMLWVVIWINGSASHNSVYNIDHFERRRRKRDDYDVVHVMLGPCQSFQMEPYESSHTHITAQCPGVAMGPTLQQHYIYHIWGKRTLPTSFFFFYKGIWEPCPSPVFILSAGVFAGVISNDPGFFAPTFQLVVRAWCT